MAISIVLFGYDNNNVKMNIRILCMFGKLTVCNVCDLGIVCLATEAV